MKERIESSIHLGGTSIDVHSTAERIVSEAVNEVRGESMTDKVEAESKGMDDQTIPLSTTPSPEDGTTSGPDHHRLGKWPALPHSAMGGHSIPGPFPSDSFSVGGSLGFVPIHLPLAISIPNKQRTERTPMIDRVLKMFKKRELPLELWLGRGRPLNPYLKGCLMDFLRGKAAPLDLKLYPQEALIGPRMAERLEKTVFASWMKQWLKYLKWYHGMEP